MSFTHYPQSCDPLRTLAACGYPVCQHPHGSKLTTAVHTLTSSTSLSTPSLTHANRTWAQCAPHSGAPPASSHTSPHCEAASNSRYRHTCSTQPDPVSVSPSDEPLGDSARRRPAAPSDEPLQHPHAIPTSPRPLYLGHCPAANNKHPHNKILLAS